jgi:hypothetical protein
MIISSHGKSQRSGRTLRTWSAMERYKQWPWCVVCDVQTNEEPFGIGHFPSSSWHATIYELRFYYSSLHIQRQQEFVFLSRVSTSAQHTISILVWTLECQVLHQASFEKDNLSEKKQPIHHPLTFFFAKTVIWYFSCLQFMPNIKAFWVCFKMVMRLLTLLGQFHFET